MDEREKIEAVLVEFYNFNKDRGFPEVPFGKTHTYRQIVATLEAK